MIFGIDVSNNRKVDGKYLECTHRKQNKREKERERIVMKNHRQSFSCCKQQKQRKNNIYIKMSALSFSSRNLLRKYIEPVNVFVIYDFDMHTDCHAQEV